jgi:hypothetical protein
MSKLYDFIGNEFVIGSYVARSGLGTKEGKYSMILFKIEDISFQKETIKVTRLNYCYSGVVSKITSWVSHNKYVVVNPPEETVNMFEHILSSPGILGVKNEDFAMKVCNWVALGIRFW